MHPDFSLPTRGRIDGRISSITAAFFQAITPVVVPSDADVDEAIAVLGMQRGECRCAYCGDARTEWDHFRPTVVKRQPTGYITEIANLVPACGKCNQSKGNRYWKDWMLGSAMRAPARRGIADLPERVARLDAFEQWRTPIRIDYVALLGKEQWTLYMAHLETATAHLSEAQKLASALLKATVDIGGEGSAGPASRTASMSGPDKTT